MNLVDTGYFLLTMTRKLTIYIFFHGLFCGLDRQIIMRKVYPLNLAAVCL